MTVFHLVRHGEHVLRDSGVVAGRRPGVGLTAKGRAEMAATAELLAGEAIAAVYASPLERTRESAEILAARLALPVDYREDLIELDFGEWTGFTFAEVRRDARFEAWRVCRSMAAIPGGESMREVQQRTVGALAALEHDHPGASLAVVSHGDVIRAALLYALGMSLDLYARLEIGLASLSTLEFDGAAFRVHRLNQRPRLSHTSSPPAAAVLPVNSQ